MPWATPTLREVRSLVRDSIRSELPGADAMVANSVLRVTSDVQGALCHLNLQMLDWLAKQLMPDTAETIWLDRHADIWLTNSDGTTGRKMATLSSGTATFTGPAGFVVPRATELQFGTIGYETLEDITLADNLVPTEGPIQALDPGVAGNLPSGTGLTILTDVPFGVGNATVVELNYGTDTENDDDLRIRVLERIRQPPMGGDKTDYVAWAKAVPGVTRAWCYPLEMGIGTVTVRFMCDELRADRDGFPAAFDVQTVTDYLNTVRPVAVKDVFVVAPLPYRVDVHIVGLSPDTESVRAGIEQSLKDMLLRLAKPGQTIYAAWKYHAIMEAPGVESFDLRFTTDDVMPSPGHMPILGDIVYGAALSTATPG
jgi:uncharacterized phage protein gp47/JayE